MEGGGGGGGDILDVEDFGRGKSLKRAFERAGDDRQAVVCRRAAIAGPYASRRW
jgi:hypothetical protein